MGVAETVAGLAEFPRRGAGTNAERRAAQWLAEQIRSPRREAVVETFWCRPNWALAHAWHTLLAVLGSLVAVGTPLVGAAMILVALVSLVTDAVTGVSIGRRLTREHASQNVVSPAPAGSPPVTLIITANYDAGRMGLVHRAPMRRSAARLRSLTGRLSPGWLGWVAIVYVWMLVDAILRNRGVTGTTIGVAQLIPTAAGVLAFALLVELASSAYGPGAIDSASGAAVALAITRALDVSPPRRLGVELVLQGAGDGSMLGLSRYLRARRDRLRAANAIVLGIGPAGGGAPRWWVSDGPLLALRFLARLTHLAQQAAGSSTGPGAGPHRGRGVSPAYPARLAGLPAITLGCLDEHGLVERSHLPTDTADAIDRGAPDRLLELALTLADAIGADVPSGTAAASRTAA